MYKREGRYESVGCESAMKQKKIDGDFEGHVLT